MVAAKMANLKVGEHAAGSSGPPYGGAQIEGGISIPDAILGSQDVAKVSIPKAAAALDVSKSSVDRAKQVLKSGDQDLIDAVEQGEVAVGVAAPNRVTAVYGRHQDGELGARVKSSGGKIIPSEDQHTPRGAGSEVSTPDHQPTLVVAAKMANLKDGEQVKHTAKKNHAPSGDAASPLVSNDMAAAALNVSASSVDRAKKVLKSGDQGLIEAVEKVAVAIAAAAPNRQPTRHGRRQDDELEERGERRQRVK
jgi:hypothetical protein